MQYLINFFITIQQLLYSSNFLSLFIGFLQFKQSQIYYTNIILIKIFVN